MAQLEEFNYHKSVINQTAATECSGGGSGTVVYEKNAASNRNSKPNLVNNNDLYRLATEGKHFTLFFHCLTINSILS